jgi:CBS domain-containing protein
MHVCDVLSTKGKLVHSCAPDDTLADVADLMVGHNIGSLVVMHEDAMVGIITERDILRACAAHQSNFVTLRVANVMTAKVATAVPTDSVEDTMGLMTSMRIRHLPVLEDGQLVGLVSIGDIVKAQHDHLTMENHYLKSYIQG